MERGFKRSVLKQKVMMVFTDAPHKTHQAVLLHLKQNRQMTVAQLCAALGITAMAVRRHLSILKREDLVAAKVVRQNRGRPTYLYSLTAKAESTFPSGYESLAKDLLDLVQETAGANGVMELLLKRNDKLVERFRPRLTSKSMPEKIQEVAKIFSENGYMTEWEQLPDGNFFIFQRNCALHSVAESYRQVCALEPRLMESLLGVTVSRQQYMLQNAPVCGYLVRCK